MHTLVSARHHINFAMTSCRAEQFSHAKRVWAHVNSAKRVRGARLFLLRLLSIHRSLFFATLSGRGAWGASRSATVIIALFNSSSQRTSGLFHSSFCTRRSSILTHTVRRLDLHREQIKWDVSRSAVHTYAIFILTLSSCRAEMKMMSVLKGTHA
jgi:hypothetical protein